MWALGWSIDSKMELNSTQDYLHFLVRLILFDANNRHTSEIPLKDYGGDDMLHRNSFVHEWVLETAHRKSLSQPRIVIL